MPFLAVTVSMTGRSLPSPGRCRLVRGHLLTNSIGLDLGDLVEECLVRQGLLDGGMPLGRKRPFSRVLAADIETLNCQPTHGWV